VPGDGKLSGMKKHLLNTCWAVALSAAITAPVFARDSSLTVEIEPDRPVVPAGTDSEVVLRLRLRGGELEIDRKNKLPLNLAVVFDRSGSMGGVKIEQARQATSLLVGKMGRDDVFSLVAYDTDVDVLIPPQKVTDKKRLRRTISKLEPLGSTALYEGVSKGAEQLKEFFSESRVNRVILLSDGLANVGPKSNREIARLGRRLADEGIAVTTVGLGDDFNEDLMTTMAEASDANYYYVQDVETLPDVFAKELGTLQQIVARDITIDITFPDGVIPIEIIGREEKIQGQKGKVRLRSLVASQERDIYLRCRVSGLPDGGGRELAQVSVQYADAGGGRGAGKQVVASVKADADLSLIASRVNHEVDAGCRLLGHNIKLDQAIAQADAGDYMGARDEMVRQRAILEKSREAAPVELQESYDKEIAVLHKCIDDFKGQAPMSKRSRKELKKGVYLWKNSK